MNLHCGLHLPQITNFGISSITFPGHQPSIITPISSPTHPYSLYCPSSSLFFFCTERLILLFYCPLPVWHRVFIFVANLIQLCSWQRPLGSKRPALSNKNLLRLLKKVSYSCDRILSLSLLFYSSVTFNCIRIQLKLETNCIRQLERKLVQIILQYLLP